MSNYTMKLLKCPACGGPMDPPGGESSMRCPYCGNAVVIPESLRKPDPQGHQSQGSLLSGVSTDAVLGYGAQWAEVVRLAKSGQKDEALKQYLNFTNVSASDARHTVDALASAQTYEFNQGSMNSVHQIYPNMMADAMGMAKSYTKWSMWLGCGITAFVMIIILITVIPILIGVAASLWAAFNI